jgi:hypothetical protein
MNFHKTFKDKKVKMYKWTQAQIYTHMYIQLQFGCIPQISSVGNLIPKVIC